MQLILSVQFSTLCAAFVCLHNSENCLSHLFEPTCTALAACHVKQPGCYARTGVHGRLLALLH